MPLLTLLPSRSPTTTSMSSWTPIMARNSWQFGYSSLTIVHLDPAVPQRVYNCRSAIIHRELFEDGSDVVLHRLIADLEGLGDFFVAVASSSTASSRNDLRTRLANCGFESTSSLIKYSPRLTFRTASCRSSGRILRV